MLTFWGLGALNLVFTGVGVVASATAMAVPIYFVTTMLGFPPEHTIRILAYSSPVWAPIGAGLGLFTAGKLFKGVRSGSDRKQLNP